MGIINRTGKSALPDVSVDLYMREPPLVKECYCPKGHSLMTDLASFDGHPGITVRLRTDTQEGLLSLSPILGDSSRTFFNFERIPGEIVDVCCPICSELLPVYNVCSCGANLVAIFTTTCSDFSNCIGICQRIGCLHSEIKSNRDLRLYSRKGYFD
jgi:hypothetical protein